MNERPTGLDESAPKTDVRTATGTSDGFRNWQQDVRAMLADAKNARIEVYVRSLSPPPGAKETQVARLKELRTLTETTPITSVSVNVWGERICLCDTCISIDAGTVMINTVRELESWGGDYGASVTPFFEQRELGSWVTGNTYETIVPPRVVVACYADGRLCGVFPSQFEDELYSVRDFYEAVRTVDEANTPVEVVDPSN